MLNVSEKIWKSGEYSYEAAYGFAPNIYGLLHEDEVERPCMLVTPGGAYRMVVDSEADPVSRLYYEAGMNVFVLTYTSDYTMSVPLKRQPLNDIARAVRYIRKNAERFHIDPNKLTIIGFSAGGHLCASLSVHHEDVKDVDSELDTVSCCPNAVILSYPVITMGEYTHEESMIALIGKDLPEDDREYFSLEKHVSKTTPPTFVWQTVEDALVPIENSAFYADGLRKAGVPYAYYAFPKGGHGLSVANEDMVNGNISAPYTSEQVNLAMEHVKNNTAVNVSPERRAELIKQFETPFFCAPPVISEDVAMWTELSKIWLRGRNCL